MSVRKDPSGKRSVQVEVEVPGTPEEVWAAIATGPGVSSWFMPADVESHVGGTVTTHFGPGMDSVAKVTAWDPPHRFAAESGDLGPNAPSLATEWIIEARAGGTCVVRVVHSLFAATDDWDDQIAEFESGWPTFFRVLRMYLTHFSGRPCSAIHLVGFAPGPTSEGWKALSDWLGLRAATAGERWTAPQGAPRLSGVVDQTGEGKKNQFALIRMEQPAPGIASLISAGMGDQSCIQITLYFYGDQAAGAVTADEPGWRAWMSQRFPMPTPARND
jgi:uncharacterized protein YndB with AHSA1/START domain